MKIRVGTDHGGYANIRNISGLPFEEVVVSRAPDMFRVPNYIYFKIRGKTNPYLLNLHHCQKGAPLDVLHLFNGIHLGQKPWFSTFETYLPRWASYGKGNLEWGLKQLAKPACKGLFALSECAKKYQMSVLDPFPELLEQIEPKLEVLHPAQSPILSQWEDKPKFSGEINMMFAGSDFFRKGGLEILRAFDAGVKEGMPLKLTVVSKLNTGDYASKASKEELEEALKIINLHPKRIFHHRDLHNDQVLKAFLQSDLGLLPTYADTYGYTVLEAQAAGCPVITTNVRALPEINPESCGWQIMLPKDIHGNAHLDSEKERTEVSRTIQGGLMELFAFICNHPNTIREKGKNAWERIRKDHDPKMVANYLEGKYKTALSL